jgi:hypothetical protein
MASLDQFTSWIVFAAADGLPSSRHAGRKFVALLGPRSLPLPLEANLHFWYLSDYPPNSARPSQLGFLITRHKIV